MSSSKLHCQEHGKSLSSMRLTGREAEALLEAVVTLPKHSDKAIQKAS